MAFVDGDGIIFVPGLFGFGSFGPKNNPVLQYFRCVIRPMEERLQLSLKGRYLFHEPPPTGPLSLRMDSLARAIDEALRFGFPNGGITPKRLHLIGHSMGGLDIRLLLNERYTPNGGPTASEKKALASYLGSAVSLSAPFYGAPFAARVVPRVPAPIISMFLLSILGSASSRVPLRGIFDLAKALVGGAPLIRSNLLQYVADLGAETAPQIQDFIDLIIEDHRLFDDLQPSSMRSLNEEIAEGDTTPIHTFVSVSPTPSPLTMNPRRALYNACYMLARPWLPSNQRAFPAGQWISSEANELASNSANDGVVPSGYQTMTEKHWPAPYLVLADHLDVVGHFEALGETFFKSGAQVDMTRFDALWHKIAEVL